LTPDKQYIIIVFLAVSIFIGLILAFFLVTFFLKEKRYRILQKQKLNAEVTAAELERSKIATQLHNDIGPFLSSVKMRLDLMQTNNEDEMDACKKVIDECVDQIRIMAKHLATLNDVEFSLEEAVRQYIEHINTKKKLVVQFQILEKIQMSPVQNSTLYRILQEIIHNTIKHANASLLKLEISSVNNEILIRTSDDGIGYDMNKVREQKKLGLGLLGIMTRVELLNGHLSQAPNTYPGTKYNITIPLDAYEKR
jgi:signal transduction histidine kinase